MVLAALLQEQTEAIRELGRIIQASRIALVIGIGISISDYFHTLSREVQFYWSGRLSIPRILYFVIRYINFPIQILNGIGFFNPPSNLVSTFYVNAQIALDLSLIWSVQAILVFRIHAAYGNNQLGRLLWVLLSVVIMSEATLGFVGINITSKWIAHPLPVLIPNLRYCVPDEDRFLQRTHYLTWVPTLVFDSIIFFLSLLKFIQFRTNSNPGVFRKSLMWTLLHDSIIYYAFLLIMAVAYMIVARINAENGEPASNIIFPLISVAGCRLLFHIRTRERARALGLGDTTFAGENGFPPISEELPSSGPIEFRVFSNSERNARGRMVEGESESGLNLPELEEGTEDTGAEERDYELREDDEILDSPWTGNEALSSYYSWRND